MSSLLRPRGVTFSSKKNLLKYTTCTPSSSKSISGRLSPRNSSLIISMLNSFPGQWGMMRLLAISVASTTTCSSGTAGNAINWDAKIILWNVNALQKLLFSDTMKYLMTLNIILRNSSYGSECFPRFSGNQLQMTLKKYVNSSQSYTLDFD